jgi:hypothetical protein
MAAIQAALIYLYYPKEKKKPQLSLHYSKTWRLPPYSHLLYSEPSELVHWLVLECQLRSCRS